jgi:hypothetical protein
MAVNHRKLKAAKLDCKCWPRRRHAPAIPQARTVPWPCFREVLRQKSFGKLIKVLLCVNSGINSDSVHCQRKSVKSSRIDGENRERALSRRMAVSSNVARRGPRFSTCVKPMDPPRFRMTASGGEPEAPSTPKSVFLVVGFDRYAAAGGPLGNDERNAPVES